MGKKSLFAHFFGVRRGRSVGAALAVHAEDKKLILGMALI